MCICEVHGFLFFHNRNTKMEWYKILLLAIFSAIAAFVAICVYIRCQNKHNEHIQQEVPTKEEPKKEDPKDEPKKESFISSGVNGATFNAMNNAIEGSHLYSNQMIQNGRSWKDVVDIAKEKNIATDGPGSIGAGKGDGYDNAFKAQCKLADAWDSVRNGFMTNEEFNKLSQEINVSTSPQSDTSLFNRGNQTCGKLTVLPNKLVCVVDEKYMDERSKNRDIFKTNTIVHCQGYDIDTNNVGRALSDSHFSKYLLNNNGTRKITSSGASTKGLKVIEKPEDKKNKNAESFKARLNKEGFTRDMTKGYHTVKNSEGGVWYHRQ